MHDGREGEKSGGKKPVVHLGQCPGGNDDFSMKRK